MAQPLPPRPQREQRIMLLKVVYNLESNTQHTLVARLPRPITVTMLLPPKVRGARARREAQASGSTLPDPNLQQPAAPVERFASAPLKTCLEAICMASPDLVMDKTKDYVLYAVDAVENYRNSLSSSLKRSDSSGAVAGHSTASSPVLGPKSASPSTPSVLAGKGYFSWALEEPGEGTSIVNGRVVGGSTFDALFNMGHGDDEDDEEDEETLEVVLRLKEAERTSRDQYVSMLDGLQSSRPPPQPLLSFSSQPRPMAGSSSLSQAVISRAVSDPSLTHTSGQQASLAHSSTAEMGPPMFPTPPLSWQLQEPSPITYQGSISSDNTPAQDASTPNQGLGNPTDVAGTGPSPGTQAQLLSLLHMLQQRQPPSANALSGDSAPVPSPTTAEAPAKQALSVQEAPLCPSAVPHLPMTERGSSQQQLAEVLGGLADIMGIPLPAGLLPPSRVVPAANPIPEGTTSGAGTPHAGSVTATVAATVSVVEKSAVVRDHSTPMGTTEAPDQMTSPFYPHLPHEPIKPVPAFPSHGSSAPSQRDLGRAHPLAIAHHGSGSSSNLKRGSLDVIAQRPPRKVRKKNAKDSLYSDGPGQGAAPSSSTGLSSTFAASAGLNSSRAASVDGDTASVASGRSEKRERKNVRRAARERAVAAAAAALAERERSAGPMDVNSFLAEEQPAQHAASEAGPLPVQTLTSKLGNKGKKKADVRAGAAALASMDPPSALPSSSQVPPSSDVTQTEFASSSSASRQISHITFAQSSPIRHSSSSDATKVNSSLDHLATPSANAISRFSFPKHLLQSSPGVAFDTLLSEVDLDFDDFAIPRGLFGSPSMVNDTLGGGGTRHQSRIASANAAAAMACGRSPSTPLRRSPRKNPAGTHASMNPYATNNAEHDLFGSDGESPLFGFVNRSPASDLGAGLSGAAARTRIGGTGLTPGKGISQQNSADSKLDEVDINDPFGSPSVHRAQRRMPSHAGSKSGGAASALDAMSRWD
ncbi:hypothetical protein OC844_003834 [Tilletia horrida]|nr:hypothetical protein OC844_003834 [Tilletia horrida]